METITDNTARAWVGCLGCYNGGRLVGKWVDGIEAADTQGAGLTDSAGHCLICNADEFWVFDHEGYEGLISGECSPMEAQEKADILEGVEEGEREILRAWVANMGAADIDLDNMRECYAGEYESDEAFAYEYVESTGMLSGIPESVARYFDYEALGRDMDMGGDIWSHNGHYFWNR